LYTIHKQKQLCSHHTSKQMNSILLIHPKVISLLDHVANLQSSNYSVMTVKRIRKEIYDYFKNPIPDTMIELLEMKEGSAIRPYGIQITIVGPESSDYAGVVFQFPVRFPMDYPFKPFHIEPVIVQGNASTRVYHLNFVGNSLCALFSNWSPAISISTLMHRLIELLISPEEKTTHCVDPEGVKLFREDPALYQQNCREWTQKVLAQQSSISLPSTIDWKDNSNRFKLIEKNEHIITIECIDNGKLQYKLDTQFVHECSKLDESCEVIKQ
jgi:ubiquitin-protein ligase